MNQRKQPMTRRKFLNTAFVVSSGALIATGLSGLRRPSTTGGAASIGILIPQAGPYSAVAPSLVAGLKLGFAEAARAGTVSMSVTTEQVAPGLRMTTDKLRNWLAADQVTLLIGSVHPGVARELHRTLDPSRTLFLAADVGANVVREGEESPHIFYSSLGDWQANWAAGAWAAGSLGRRAFVASSLNESGYDSLYAFNQGLESAGGQVVRTRVTHVPPAEFNWAPLLSAIKAAEPDFVYALYSGRQAVDFVRAYADFGLAGRIPLVGSPFMVDEALLPQQGAAALGVLSVHPWAPGLDTPENAAFTAAYRGQTGRAPDSFALLGYETAQLTAQALTDLNAGTWRIRSLRQALRNARFVSPRGQVRMDARTQTAAAPLYLREVRQGPGGLHNGVMAALPPAEPLDRRLGLLRRSIRTGWLNPYLPS